MKIEQKQAFQPIAIVLETKEEAERFWDLLRYWLWRRWFPAKCTACGARYGHRGDCDGIPF